MSGPAQVGGVFVEVPNSLSLKSYDDPAIDASFSFVGDATGIGYTDVLLVDVAPSLPMLTGPVLNFPLVTLHSATARKPFLLDAEATLGGTIFLEPTFDSVPISQISLSVAPEPASWSLVALLLGAALTRPCTRRP